jgi:hypothetical protein
MPLYNCGRYFEAAARSVSEQTHSDFEVVAVDDGSTDTTAALAEQWAARDQRVRLFRTAHGGLVSALNAGISKCQGALVARMDGDDIALPQRLERQLRVLRERPEVGVVGCAYDELHGEERRPGPRVRTEPEVLAWRAHFFVVVPHPTAVFRRELLQRIGGYSPDVQAAEDFNLFRRLSRITHFTNVPEVLYLYRRHPEAFTQRYSGSIEANAVRVCQVALEELLAERVPSEVAAQVWKGAFRRGDPRPAQTVIRAFGAFSRERHLSRLDRRAILADVLWLLHRGGSLAEPTILRFSLRHPVLAARTLAARAVRG